MGIRINPDKLNCVIDIFADNSYKYLDMVNGIRFTMLGFVLNDSLDGCAISAAKNQASAHISVIDFFECINWTINIECNNVRNAMFSCNINTVLDEDEIIDEIKNVDDKINNYNYFLSEVERFKTDMPIFASTLNNISILLKNGVSNLESMKNLYNSALNNLYQFEEITKNSFNNVDMLFGWQQLFLNELECAGLDGNFPVNSSSIVSKVYKYVNSMYFENVEDVLFYTDKYGDRRVSKAALCLLLNADEHNMTDNQRRLFERWKEYINSHELKNCEIELLFEDYKRIIYSYNNDKVYISNNNKAMIYKGDVWPIYAPSKGEYIGPKWTTIKEKRFDDFNFDVFNAVGSFSLESEDHVDTFNKTVGIATVVEGLSNTLLSSMSRSSVYLSFKEADNGQKRCVLTTGSSDNFDYGHTRLLRDSQNNYLKKKIVEDYIHEVYKKDLPEGEYDVKITTDKNHNDEIRSGLIYVNENGEWVQKPFRSSGDSVVIVKYNDPTLKFGYTELEDGDITDLVYSEKVLTLENADMLKKEIENL